MVSQAVNTLMQNLAKQNLGITAKPTFNIERTHFSGPTGGSYHYHHNSHSSGGSKKNNIALSALTLLSFLFFLHILQNCMQDQLNEMYPTQQVVIMQARLKAREAEAQKRKGETEIFPNSTTTEEINEDDTFEPEARIKSHGNTVRHVPVKIRTVSKNKS